MSFCIFKPTKKNLINNNPTKKNLINNKPTIHYIIPVGHYCLTAKHLVFTDKRKMALPFDWIRVSLDNVIHILENDFKFFLDKKYYQQKGSFLLNGKRFTIKCKHTFYTKDYPKQKPLHPIVNRFFNHHEPHNKRDYQYLQRCVQRFRMITRDENVNKLFLRVEEYEPNGGNTSVEKLKRLNDVLATLNYTLNYKNHFIVLIILHRVRRIRKPNIERYGNNVTVIHFNTLVSRKRNFMWLRDKNEHLRMSACISKLFNFSLSTFSREDVSGEVGKFFEPIQ